MTQTQSAPRTADQIETWLRGYIAGATGSSVDDVGRGDHFDSFGLDSLQGIEMLTGLESWLGMSDYLPLDSIFGADSIGDAAAQIGRMLAGQEAR